MSDVKPEQSLEEDILKAFRMTIVNLVLNTNRIADKLGCNPSDLQVLHLVELAGAITPKELAQRTNLTTGGITVVLDRLEKENFIRREKHPTDRRSLLITLSSSKRRGEVDEVYKEYAENFLKTLSHYTQADMKVILGFLEEINKRGIPEEL
jgi:DNA-binding MarR family transcriptional regulator